MYNFVKIKQNNDMNTITSKSLFIFLSIVSCFICFMPFSSFNDCVLADETLLQNDMYVIYSEDGKYLFERQNVMVGDEYIDKQMRCYIVISIDEKTKTGVAKYECTYEIPKVKVKEDASVQTASNSQSRGHIGLYMTHNDESYVSGDGYDSIYGKGGVHDIAKAFALNLNSKKIETTLDETLHIPHDSYAYSRSNTTAKKLLQKNVDALFDIHRDGTSRGFYITEVNGEERCMVRMVVGKANPNYAKNKAFALFLMSVSKTYAPWLFVDIYMASGHYNQNLNEYMMLFEMGSHLVEKDLVLKTVPELAEVVNVALFGELEEVEDENDSSSNGNEENEDSEDNNGNTGNNDNIENSGSNDKGEIDSGNETKEDNVNFVSNYLVENNVNDWFLSILILTIALSFVIIVALKQ